MLGCLGAPGLPLLADLANVGPRWSALAGEVAIIALTYGPSPQRAQSTAHEIAVAEGAQARRLLALESDDHFVGVDDVEVLADQLTDKIRIGMVRIQCVDLNLELVALMGEAGDLCMTSIEQAQVIAPRKQAARPGNRHSAKQQQYAKRDALGEPFLRRGDGMAFACHNGHRITVNPAFQDLCACELRK